MPRSSLTAKVAARAASHLSRGKKAPSRRKKKEKDKTPKKEKERCMICKKVMDRVSAAHLRTHGYTLQRYDRMYGIRPPRTSTKSGSLTDPQASNDLVNAVAERLLHDRVWLSCFSDEVGERMMNGPLRQRLSWLLTTMLAQRATVHGKALAMLSGALTELEEDWRVVQGGEDGGPTSTDELLRMVDRAGKLVKESEDAVQRTIKLALEEQRAESQWADAAGPTLYRGDAEKLDMPTGVTTGDREVIRNLLSMIGKHAEQASTLDVSPLGPERNTPPIANSPESATPQAGPRFAGVSATIAKSPSEVSTMESGVSTMENAIDTHRQGTNTTESGAPLTGNAHDGQESSASARRQEDDSAKRGTDPTTIAVFAELHGTDPTPPPSPGAPPSSGSLTDPRGINGPRGVGGLGAGTPPLTGNLSGDIGGFASFANDDLSLGDGRKTSLGDGRKTDDDPRASGGARVVALDAGFHHTGLGGSVDMGEHGDSEAERKRCEARTAKGKQCRRTVKRGKTCPQHTD
jgi:hypothetical protein